MSAGQARIIKSVKRVGQQVLVTVRERGDDTKPSYDVEVSELPRHELIKAAVKLGLKPGTDNGRWTGLGNDDIQRMMHDKFNLGFHGTRNDDEGRGDNEDENKGEHDDEDGMRDGGEGEPDPLAPSEFEFNIPEDMQPKPSDSLEEQAEKLQQAMEARNKAKEEHDKQEEEKREKREQWNKQERERRQQEQQAREEQRQREEEERKKEQEEQQEFFEQFNQRKNELSVPDDAHPQLMDILDALLLGQDVYLAGPAGTGKSYLTEQCAQILKRRYYSISFGPQTPESRLWGYHDATGNYVKVPFRHFYDARTADDDGAIFCGDEVDNGNPGITTTLNQSLAGSGATFPDGWVDRHVGARMMTTANTWGQGATAEFMGRNPLDAAFLNRFTKFNIPTDEDLEYKLVEMNSNLTNSERDAWIEVVHKLRSNAETYKIRAVVSMRDAITGAQLKSIGWSTRKVLDARVLTGLPEARVEHLLQGVEC